MIRNHKFMPTGALQNLPRKYFFPFYASSALVNKVIGITTCDIVKHPNPWNALIDLWSTAQLTAIKSFFHIKSRSGRLPEVGGSLAAGFPCSCQSDSGSGWVLQPNDLCCGSPLCGIWIISSKCVTYERHSGVPSTYLGYVIADTWLNLRLIVKLPWHDIEAKGEALSEHRGSLEMFINRSDGGNKFTSV